MQPFATCCVSPDIAVLRVMLQAKTTQLLLIHPSVLQIPDCLCIALDKKKEFLDTLCNWNILHLVHFL